MRKRRREKGRERGIEQRGVRVRVEKMEGLGLGRRRREMREHILSVRIY